MANHVTTVAPIGTAVIALKYRVTKGISCSSTTESGGSRVRQGLKDYILAWLAILPVLGFVGVTMYLTVEYWKLPTWIVIIVAVVAVHVAVGWIMLVVKFAENRGW